MKYKLFKFFGLFFCSALLFAPTPGVCKELKPGSVIHSETPSVLPESTTMIVLSSKDVNRVTCATPILDVVYSEEKGVDVKFTGNNAFVKFKITVDPRTGMESFATKPSEIYFVCGQDIYSLIAQPKEVAAQTIRLSGGKKKELRKNQQRFKGMPFEKKILKILKEVYAAEVSTATLPSSYKQIKRNKKVEMKTELEVLLKKEVVLEGEGLQVKVLNVRAAASRKGKNQKVQLAEEDFLVRTITTKAVAVALEKSTLFPMEATIVLVVEKRGEN